MDNLLKDGLTELHIDHDPSLLSDYAIYKDLLVDWNQRMNLTGITETKDVYIKHFLDSLSAFTVDVFSEGCKVIDVGTGAGFPGLPMAILNRSIQMTLLDSLNKRVHFLEAVAQSIGLNNVECIHGRAEDFGQNEQFRELYDVAVSRAVAHLSVLSEYVLPFVKVGGVFLALKGPNVTTELEEAGKALALLGGVVKEVKMVQLPFTDIQHSIVVIQKVEATPGKYPRKAGKPTKTPLK